MWEIIIVPSLWKSFHTHRKEKSNIEQASSQPVVFVETQSLQGGASTNLKTEKVRSSEEFLSAFEIV